MNQFTEFVLLAGSSSLETSEEKLRAAHEFVDALVPALFRLGIGIIVFAADEVPSEVPGLQLIFDWTALSAARKALSDSVEPAGPRVIVVTSPKLDERRIPRNRDLLLELRRRGAVWERSIPDEAHTGGSIVRESSTAACGLIAVGGGKGIIARARSLQELGKPIVPLDFRIGSAKRDGSGAAGLSQESLRSPRSFFPGLGSLGTSRVPPPDALIAEPRTSAIQVAGVLKDELAAARRKGPCDVLLLTALPLELSPLLSTLNLTKTAPEKIDGIAVWQFDLPTTQGASIDLRIACLATPGTTSAAIKAASLIKDLRPRLVLLVGIAGGLKDKLQLREVVFAESVVAYESAAIVEKDGVEEQLPRPVTFAADPEAWQGVSVFLSDPQSIGQLRSSSGDQIRVSVATVASGEKLLRSAQFFGRLARIHSRVAAVEMEAAGVAAACVQFKASFLMIRAISDHGDSEKRDTDQLTAAENAATVALAYLRQTGSTSLRRDA